MSKNVEEELSIFCMEIEHNFLPYMSYFPFQHFCNDGKITTNYYILLIYQQSCNKDIHFNNKSSNLKIEYAVV